MAQSELAPDTLVDKVYQGLQLPTTKQLVSTVGCVFESIGIHGATEAFYFYAAPLEPAYNPGTLNVVLAGLRTFVADTVGRQGRYKESHFIMESRILEIARVSYREDAGEIFTVVDRAKPSDELLSFARYRGSYKSRDDSYQKIAREILIKLYPHKILADEALEKHKDGRHSWDSNPDLVKGYVNPTYVDRLQRGLNPFEQSTPGIVRAILDHFSS